MSKSRAATSKSRAFTAKHNGRPGNNGLFEFISAAADNDVELMKDIVKDHPGTSPRTYVHGKPAGESETALIKAASLGNLQAVNYLLKIGGEEATRNMASSFQGETPLHRAAINGHTDVVRALLDAHANVEATAHRSGFTPADFAGCKGHDDIVKLLLKARSSDPRPGVCRNLQGERGRGGARKTGRKGRKTRRRA
jgi:Ankyrin repeats (3 copies)